MAEPVLGAEDLDRRVRAAHRRRRRAERALAACLRDVRDRGLAEARGFADVFHYASLAADLSPAETSRLLEIAEPLSRLPAIAGAFETGELPLAKVRALCRIASPETEAGWLAESRLLPAWALESLAERARYGDTPPEARSRPAPRDAPEELPFVLRVSAQAHALLTEALRRLRRETGSLEEAIVAFATALLGRARPEGQAPPALRRPTSPPFQWVLYRCEACGETELGGSPAATHVGRGLADVAACDAEKIDLRSGASRSRSIPPRIRRAVWLRDRGRCRAPECRNSLWADVHHVRWRSRGGDHRPENLVVLCTTHHAAVHEGRLRIQLDPAGGISWLHADGGEFGASWTRAVADEEKRFPPPPA
ncbi:MAG: HNH endonuclease [Planctomycetes bacterium]|nr:HNH endonuclease [Planctomycetota bacterium]